MGQFSSPDLPAYISREYLSQQLKTRADTVIMPLLAQLRFKEVSLRLADDVLRLKVRQAQSTSPAPTSQPSFH